MSVKPSVLALMRGGPTERASAAGQMLAKGGAVEEEEGLGEVSEGMIAAAEEIIEITAGGWNSPSRDDDSKVEKAAKDAAKRAKAKMLAEALKAFFLMVDVDE